MGRPDSKNYGKINNLIKLVQSNRNRKVRGQRIYERRVVYAYQGNSKQPEVRCKEESDVFSWK